MVHRPPPARSLLDRPPQLCPIQRPRHATQQAREKLRLAAGTTDREKKQQLAEAAFQLAQDAEALERAEQNGRPQDSGGRDD